MRARSLQARGLPTTWFHGTYKAFDRIRPQKAFRAVWLGDARTAEAYATPRYAKSGSRIIEVQLSPDTSVVDLSDPKEKLLPDMLLAMDEASRYSLAGRAYTLEEWLRNDRQFGALERFPWLAGWFRRRKVDALLVRDVEGWSGHSATTSLALLNTRKIVSETSLPIGNKNLQARTRTSRGADCKPTEGVIPMRKGTKRSQVLAAIEAAVAALEDHATLSAGGGYENAQMFLLLTPTPKSAPFNRDTIDALYQIRVNTGSGFDESDQVGVSVINTWTAPIVNRVDEAKGAVRETVVALSIPKGTERQVLKQATRLLNRGHMSNSVEHLPRFRKPEVVMGR